MDRRLPVIAEQMLLIERELRLQGWWSAQSPSDEALASQEPFAVDSLDFAEWLQWIMLPRMKFILENDQPLPSASGILAMAEMVYQDRAAQSRGLRSALEVFDRLISEAGAASQ